MSSEKKGDKDNGDFETVDENTRKKCRLRRTIPGREEGRQKNPKHTDVNEHYDHTGRQKI